MRFSPYSNHFLRLALPILSIAAVSITGAALLHSSHALDTTSENFSAALSHVAELPTAGNTSCCQISVDKAIVTNGSSRHVTATVTIKNTTGSVAQISPGLQMFVVDGAGNEHPYTAAYMPAGATIGGPLSPDASSTEKLDFDLAPNDTPTLFVFQQDASASPLVLRMPS